jgi:DNA-binding response OmpR family regulator
MVIVSQGSGSGMSHILIVDDDTGLCDLLAEYLSLEGFVVDSAYDGEEGETKALSGNYDLVILDVMLPRVSGFDVLRSLRAKSSVPVLMLTAKGGDVDRIVGLEMGAADRRRLRDDLRTLDNRRAQERKDLQRQIDELQARLGSPRERQG